MSEDTDAAVAIVSEETGIISVAYRGELYRDLEATELRELLQSIFLSRPGSGSKRDGLREVVARLRALNPGLTILARAHSDAEVKHLIKHGADGAVLAEKELAHSMAEMALSAPPFRHQRA